MCSLNLRLLCASLFLGWGVCARAGHAGPSFTHDIRPILAARCFACHGPDEESREAGLRLDDRDTALAFGAIVPGKPEESELLRRVTSEDAAERMPPEEVGEPLTSDEVKLLKQWIADGAEYSPHWAFVPPSRPELPETTFEDRCRNEIDRFVFARLESEGLSPSPEADPYTLVRRLYLDLIGLPPTPQQADAYVHSDDADAYERLVDELLTSKQYGEHWARDWLDLARYADTNGYEKDRPRSIWPYRDWVIRALNNDMPFDQFTIEQLAGDMLPEPTVAQRVATGFHRNTMLNEEGGIDPLEYRFYAMVDRVATTGTVWMGLTTECAQCHTHKYDPITHTEYYRLMALLNNADEPDVTIPNEAIVERRRRIKEQIEQLGSDLANRFPASPIDCDGADLPAAEPDAQLTPDAGLVSTTVPETPGSAVERYDQKFAEWLTAVMPDAVRWQVLTPTDVRSNLPRLEVLDDGSVFSSGDITKRDVFDVTVAVTESELPVTALRLEVLPDERLPSDGPGRAYYEGRKGDFFLSELTVRRGEEAVPLTAASHSYGKISIGSGSADAGNVIDGNGSTGWSTSGREGKPSQLVVNLAEPLTSAGDLTITLLFERHFAASLGRFRLSATSAPGPVTAKGWPVEVEQLLTRDPASWSEDERLAVRRQFHREAPELDTARTEIDKLRESLPALPESLVMDERPADNPRPTFRHHRGEYLSPREPVGPGIPAVFLDDESHQPRNRLELARWLVSEENPLVARVTVNRAWQSFFGIGIVRSSDDFGTQAEPPSHSQLLDWLAVEFIERGWSLKQLHRMIVMSATYRQSSHVSDELAARDPENRLLARGPRLRINAEVIRDSMLNASGLLSSRMYGPSVYPPQPKSVTALAYGASPWDVSEGEDRYRRSLYTFSKRTAPFAAYTVFDAPTGETCIARRSRSNTPLQSLTLLNDEMYLEMARALATSAVEHSPEGAKERVTFIFRRLLTRPPTPEELEAITAFHNAQMERLQSGELKPAAIAGAEDATVELASTVLVSRALMNLDEAITKP